VNDIIRVGDLLKSPSRIVGANGSSQWFLYTFCVYSCAYRRISQLDSARAIIPASS